MAVVVSDTSPLRCLHHLGLLHLLGALFGEVLVPPAVVGELRSTLRGDIAAAVLASGAVKVRAPSNASAVSKFGEVLDPGESEAFALALEVGASLVLVDEQAGRAAAAAAGLETMGVLGLLIRAKGRQLIGPLAPLIDRLRQEANFFISDSLRTKVLRDAGE